MQNAAAATSLEAVTNIEFCEQNSVLSVFSWINYDLKPSKASLKCSAYEHDEIGE